MFSTKMKRNLEIPDLRKTAGQLKDNYNSRYVVFYVFLLMQIPIRFQNQKLENQLYIKVREAKEIVV